MTTVATIRFTCKTIEDILSKPRAFTTGLICHNAPVRKRMIFLGADVPLNYETSKHHKRLIKSRKYRKDEPLY